MYVFNYCYMYITDNVYVHYIYFIYSVNCVQFLLYSFNVDERQVFCLLF